MPSVTEVANIALALLGEKQIASIDDDTTPADLLSAHQEQVFKEVQSSYRWQELIAAAALTASETLHADGSYLYPLPADCLRVLDVWMSSGVPVSVEYRLEDDNVVSLYASPYVTYLRYLSAPGSWSPLLTRCVAYVWALRVGLTLTGNAALVQALRREYEVVVLPECRRLQSYAERDMYKPDRYGWNQARRYALR